MSQVTAKHYRKTPEQIAQRAQRIRLGPVVDDQVGASHQAIEVLHRGVAADKRLRLIEVGGGAAVEPAELDCLIVIQRAQPAPLYSLEYLLQPAPLRPALLDEACQVHGCYMRVPVFKDR